MEDIFDEEYLSGLVADGEPYIPPEEQKQIEESAQQLNESINNFKEGEAVYGSQPETYEQAKPKQEATVEAIQEMTSTYADDEAASEIKQEKKEKAVGLMQEQSDFFKAEYERMQERDRQTQLQLEAMRKQLELMQQMMQSFSPDTVAKCVQDGMKFLHEAEAIRQEAQGKKQSGYADMYKTARYTVNDIYTNIKETPQRIKEAVQEKAYEAADKAILSVAEWFDKGIKFLTAKKQAIIKASPLEKLDNQENNVSAYSRLATILSTPMDEAYGRKNYQNRFLQIMKKNYQRDPANYAVNTVKDCLELKLQKIHIKACLQKFAPECKGANSKQMAKFLFDKGEKSFKAEFKNSMVR